MRWPPARRYVPALAGDRADADVSVVPSGGRHLVPRSGSLPGIGVLVSVIGEKVEAFGSAWVTGVPGEFLEDLRKAIRKHLRQKGGDRRPWSVASAACDVSRRAGGDRTDRAGGLDRSGDSAMGVVEQPTDDEAIVDQRRLGVAWQTGCSMSSSHTNVWRRFVAFNSESVGDVWQHDPPLIPFGKRHSD